MKQLEILEYLGKVQKQRAFLLATLAAFMSKEFEDQDTLVFRMVIAQALVDQIHSGDIHVGDEIETATLKEVREMIERQAALEELKSNIKGGNPL